MGSRRSLIDRLLQLVRPAPIASFAPPPVRIDSDLWTLERRLRMPGGAFLSSRTTLISLPSRGLLVVSPPPVEVGGLEGLDALGDVAEVLLPNSFHHVNASGFVARYPRAVLRVSPGLFGRVGGLPPGEELTEQSPRAWSGAVEHAILGPVRGVSEVALFHRVSRTLVLTDLAFHMVRLERRFDRVAWRLAGIPSGFGPSRTAHRLLLCDRGLAGAFLERLLAWPFQRVLVAHGDPLETDAVALFRRAFAAYLPSTRSTTDA